MLVLHSLIFKKNNRISGFIIQTFNIFLYASSNQFTPFFSYLQIWLTGFGLFVCVCVTLLSFTQKVCNSYCNS